MVKLLVAVMLSFALFLLFGCTKEEEKQFNDAIMEGVKQSAIDTLTGKGNSSISISMGDDTKKGECRFDSDCAPECDGGVFWKKGCDAQTDKCVRTFDTDCSAQFTYIGSDSFSKLCTPSCCVEDTDAIRASKDDLISQANDYTAAMQEATELRQIAAKNCISALADVTDKLIIDTALTFGRLPKSSTSIYSVTTKQTINTLGNAATGGSGKMSAEEFISLNCNAIRALDTDYAVASKKRDLVMEQAKLYEGR